MSANDHVVHEGPIKTTSQLAWTLAVSFIGLPVMLVFLATIVISIVNKQAAHDEGASGSDAVAARIKPVAEVILADASGAGSGPRTGDAVVKAACAGCHVAGVANAPKIGDKAAWGKVMGAGMNAMVASAIKGKNAMPARGGAADLTDFEIARAIAYMANQSGLKVAEPAEPKK